MIITFAFSRSSTSSQTTKSDCQTQNSLQTLISNKQLSKKSVSPLSSFRSSLLSFCAILLLISSFLFSTCFKKLPAHSGLTNTSHNLHIKTSCFSLELEGSDRKLLNQPRSCQIFQCFYSPRFCHVLRYIYKPHFFGAAQII